MGDSQTTIVCVHQGYELYGSDRSFSSCVHALAAGSDAQIKVVLPRSGPIDQLFADMAEGTLEYRDLLVLRKADLVSTLTTRLRRSIRSIHEACRMVRAAGSTYVNTAVLLDFMLAGWLTRRPMVIHVREIPTGFSMYLIRTLLRMSGASLIYNSHATRTAFALPESIPQFVVWNSFADPGAPVDREPYDGDRRLRVLCIGRLNSWKGQDDLLTAAAALSIADRDRIDIRIVGSVFEKQAHFSKRLERFIRNKDLSSTVSLQTFQDDPSEVYRWADVVIVPSRKPEPFGRVAIEAMAYGCAVVGTAHGGLPEIVENERTGMLVPPTDPAALAQALSRLIGEPGRVAWLGRAGRERFTRHFTEEAFQRNFLEVFRKASNLR